METIEEEAVGTEVKKKRKKTKMAKDEQQLDEKNTIYLKKNRKSDCKYE